MKKWMMMIVPALLIAWWPAETAAQSRKKAEKYGIASTTAVDYEDGKTLQNRKRIFDKTGEIVVDYNYDRNGALDKLDKYKYNADRDVLEHEEYDAKKKKTTRAVMEYNGLGEKVSETVYDGDGNKLKTHYYTYNSKGLKTERKTVDPSGKTISVRKYTYTYR